MSMRCRMPPPADQTQYTENHIGKIIWAAVLALISALLILGLALRPPTLHYLIAGGLTCLACLIVAAVLVIAWLVKDVSGHFGTRYTAMEQRVESYQKEVSEFLKTVTCRQMEILAAVAATSREVKALDAKVDLHDQQRGGQATRWIDEISVLAEKVETIHADANALSQGVDELREAFIDEGLPGHLENRGTARATGTLGGHAYTAASGSALNSNRDPSNGCRPRRLARFNLIGPRNSTINCRRPGSGTRFIASTIASCSRLP